MADRPSVSPRMPRSAASTSVPTAQRIRERHRILRRLGNARADMRARHKSGIADQRNPAEAHARHVDVVDRLQERAICKSNTSRNCGASSALAGAAQLRNGRIRDQRRRDRNLVSPPAARRSDSRASVGFIGWPVPDDIVAPVTGPQVVVRAGDRIAQHLLARRQAEGQGIEQIAVQSTARTTAPPRARATPRTRHRATAGPAAAPGARSSEDRRRRSGDHRSRSSRRRNAAITPLSCLLAIARTPDRDGNTHPAARRAAG